MQLEWNHRDILIDGGAGSLRARSFDESALSEFMAPVGLFSRPKVDLQMPFAVSSVELPEIYGRSTEPAIGRADSFAQSNCIAALEGLERHCGRQNGVSRIAVRREYRQLTDRAIFVPSLGLHPTDSYSADGFPFRPYSDDVVVDWVEGHSLSTGRAVLVPERVAYWGPRYDGEVRFVYETSNGCALGSSLQEAAIHGIFELVERDAFLLAWYRQLRLPEIDRASFGRPVRTLLEKCEAYVDTRFRFFLSTMEHGIPSIFACAVSNQLVGPQVFAGAGAHLDLAKAISGAVYELTAKVVALRSRYETVRPMALEMLRDASLVRTIDHHPAVNCLPEARGHFSFLLDSGEKVPLPAHIPRATNDLRQVLASMVNQFGTKGLEVIVVDQTLPEIERVGLNCVKVLIPGLLPMTFGHHNRRTEHLPRLDGRVQLPYTSNLGQAGMARDPWPHPFD